MRPTLLAVLLAFAGAVAAQVPKNAAARIKEIGPVLNPEMIGEMFKLYAPLMPKPPAGLAMQEDLAHGPPESDPARVYPPEKKPERALRGWVQQTRGEDGGDRGGMVLLGQSAGARRVAHYVFDKSRQPKDGADGVKGGSIQSGIFDPAAGPAGPNVEAYFGKAHESWHAKSLYGKLQGRKIPVFIISAEFDPPPFKEVSAKLRDELCKLRGCPRHTELAGHNHLSEILHLNTADDSMGTDILGFVRFPR